MKEFQFQYTDRELLILIVAGCFFLFAGLMILFLIVAGPQPPGIKALIPFFVSLGIPMGIFFSQVKRYRKYASAMLYRDKVIFNVDNDKIEIDFDRIKKIRIWHYRGTRLTIVIKESDPLRFVATYFSNEEGLDHLSTSLEQAFNSYRASTLV